MTGASSGLGLAAAGGFARLGASVRQLARSEERGERARARIAARSGNSDVHVNLFDLSDLEAVRQFASSFTAETTRLDVLVNNVGALLNGRAVSVDGIELTFATSLLGPFLPTNLLIALLETRAPARIISVSSGGMYTQRIDVEDLQAARETFDGPAVYARTKPAQVILTELWAKRREATGVVVDAMHPGWADTQASSRQCRCSTRRPSRCYALQSKAPTRRLDSCRPRATTQLRCLLAGPPPAPDRPYPLDRGDTR